MRILLLILKKAAGPKVGGLLIGNMRPVVLSAKVGNFDRICFIYL